MEASKSTIKESELRSLATILTKLVEENHQHCERLFERAQTALFIEPQKQESKPEEPIDPNKDIISAIRLQVRELSRANDRLQSIYGHYCQII